ncbi:hypothetical protein GLOTRDRAFT_10551, partial [Gloeophyllum trabeum ATCC 11539]
RVVRGLKNGMQMDLPLTLTQLETEKRNDVIVLLDTGCTGSCINENTIVKLGLEQHHFENDIPVFNADGTLNAAGNITEYIRVKGQIGNHEEVLNLLITNLGKSDVFLGYEWLDFHNPKI